MKFKGLPKQLVRITKIKPNLVRKVPKSIRFDVNGIFETENSYLIKRLLTKFKEVKEIVKVEEVVKTDYHKIEYKELQNLYTEKTGNSAIGVSKINIIKELEG